MSFKIFKFEDGTLTVDTIELLGIDSFRSIIKGNKTAKEQTFKELMYVWLMADNDSPVNRQGKSGKEASEFAKAKAGLPKEWKPYPDIERAIVDYADANSSVAKDVISELLKTFGYYSKVVTKVRGHLENTINSSTALNKVQAEEIVGLIKSIIAISKDIPNEIKNLNVALADLKLTENKADRDVLRGTDDIVPDSADPNRDY